MGTLLNPAFVKPELPPTPIQGVEIRCPHCRNLYGVIAATMGTAEFRCTRPRCKQLPSGGIFTITVVSVPQAVTILSDLVAAEIKNHGQMPVQDGGAMFFLTKHGTSTIIRR